MTNITSTETQEVGKQVAAAAEDGKAPRHAAFGPIKRLSNKEMISSGVVKLLRERIESQVNTIEELRIWKDLYHEKDKEAEVAHTKILHLESSDWLYSSSIAASSALIGLAPTLSGITLAMALTIAIILAIAAATFKILKKKKGGA